MSNAIVTLTMEEVAGLLGWSRITFTRKYRDMVATQGFPVRMPGGNFFGPAIERWMAQASGMAPDTTPVSPVAAQREMLERHYREQGRAA